MNIEFIIPTYNRPNQLLCCISSIVSQYSPNWRVHVVADGVYDGYDRIKDIFKNESRIRFSELDGPHNDWGHTPRNFGLDRATEEWVVMTGDDNYYMPIFVGEFLKAAELDTHFVYCNLVHDWGPSKNYIPLDSEPKINKIDIGNFMTKTEYSKQIKLNTEYINADGRFVLEYLKKFDNKEIVKINKILYVHN